MIQVQEVNPCPTVWHSNFRNTDIWKSIQQLHPYVLEVISTHKEMTLLKASLHHTVYEYPSRFLDMYNIVDSTPYYYINYLLETNPQEIIDIGCGDNVFKKTFPELITGLDNDNTRADINKEFNQEFANSNQQRYDAAISINCIHFSPIDTIADRLLLVAQLLKPGSRAFVTFNIETWLMFTNRLKIESMFGTVPKWEDVVNYVNDQILVTGLNFLVVDWPVLHITEHSSIRDEYIGNIRLVFSKE